MQPNIAPPIIKSKAEQVAEHFVINHAGLVPSSLTDLSNYYGVTKNTVRQGIHLADARLAGRGQTLTVPNRGDQWRMSVTDDALTLATSFRGRVAAMASEWARLQGKLAACANQDPTLNVAFSDVTVGFSSFLAATAP